jgi:hypothetical protein
MEAGTLGGVHYTGYIAFQINSKDMDLLVASRNRREPRLTVELKASGQGCWHGGGAL